MPEFVRTELIFGRRPVVEVLRGPRRVFQIFLTEPAKNFLQREMRKYGISKDFRLSVVSKQYLYNLIKRPDHQGIVARAEEFEYTPLDIIIDRQPEILVLAEGITDPHNLGAIIRSANLCGAGGVIIPTKNSAQITPVVVHTSAGATEHTPIARAESLAHTLGVLKDHGYTVIVADKPSPNSVPITKFEPAGKIAVVMGSEGEGVSGKVRRKGDVIVSIPQAGEIDSFNVSVAAGIILFYIAHKLGILSE